MAGWTESAAVGHFGDSSLLVAPTDDDVRPGLAPVWNARRHFIDHLEDNYASDTDRVDLPCTILHCHSWVRSDEPMVVVRLEPLQQPARRRAQEQLCRKLTGLAAKIPDGKWLRIEVDESPL